MANYIKVIPGSGWSLMCGSYCCTHINYIRVERHLYIMLKNYPAIPHFSSFYALIMLRAPLITLANVSERGSGNDTTKSLGSLLKACHL